MSSLQKEIDDMRKEIRTDGYSMSIGEWISLYENNEIDIHPEFQRFFRWTPQQKSNFIESLLLGIPVPPIFVSQRKDGVWDVIDGLQRLSTIYQFVGILKDENNNNIAPLVLEPTRYLPSLKGKKWNDPDDSENSFTMEQRLLIKRAKISARIILRESDERAKYDLFQRINTGGSQLTPQEVRNCILVMINKYFYSWLRTLANYEPFQECIALSDKNLIEQYDMELALRFIVFVNQQLETFEHNRDIGEYLTDAMIQLASEESFDKNEVESKFKGTFDVLAACLGSNSFRRWDGSKNKFLGGFLLSPYEVVAFGIGYNYPNIPSPELIEEKIKNLYSDETYRKWSGSGVRANSRIPNLLPLGRELFKA